MTSHDKRIEDIDKKMKIGRFSPNHPSQFTKLKDLDKNKGETEHKHKFYLKSKSFGGPYYRKCSECGKITKTTKYRIDI